MRSPSSPNTTGEGEFAEAEERVVLQRTEGRTEISWEVDWAADVGDGDGDGE